MRTTFIDTSYLLALVLSDDAQHERALAWQRALVGRLLTTEYVLIEFLDALCEPRLRSIALQTVSLVRESPTVRVLPVSTTTFDEGLRFFAAHADKRWGITDCISFLTMRQERITDALTCDQHFEQAGFRALLKTSPSQ